MKILIVKTSSFGDVIHTFPVVGYLKKQFPDCQIDWVVEESIAELVQSHPKVDHVIPINSKQWFRGLNGVRNETYDLLFDLQGNIKSGIVTLFAKAKEKVGFAYSDVAEWPNILVTGKKYSLLSGRNIRDDYLSIVQQHLGEDQRVPLQPVTLRISSSELDQIREILRHPNLAQGRRVMICPGSAWPNKRLNEKELKSLCEEYLLGQPTGLMFAWGTDEEKELVERLFQAFPKSSMVLPKLGLPLLQNLMERIDLVVSMDSLPLHLAGTTTTPTTSYFGPSSGKKYSPKGSQHTVHQSECPYGRTFEKRCPILRSCPTGACMRSAKQKAAQ